MPTRYLKLGLGVVIALTLSVMEYRSELSNILEAAEQTVRTRASLMSRYITLMRQNVYSLEYAIEARYREAERFQVVAAELDLVRYFPAHGVWGLSGLAEEGGVASLSGSLTGAEPLENPTEELQRELTAVLSVDSQFRSLIEHLPEVIWVYYTSANEFIYIAPDPPIKDVRFSTDLYAKAYWSQAAPSSNPEGDQIISDLYEDAYDKGWMISISSPVSIDGRFLGVVAVDLGVTLLRSNTGFGRALGDSILVDEHDRIVVRSELFSPDETYLIPYREGQWVSAGDRTLWFAEEVTPGELTLLHRLPRTLLYWQAVKRSVQVWLLLAAVWVVIGFIMRLDGALSEVTNLMHRDALTGLLNRRGFKDALLPLQELARREGRSAALLLLDIDHFKCINDTYGHDVGDQVLEGIAHCLHGHIREYDVLCRWGGEEILVYMAKGDHATYLAVAERLRWVIEAEPISQANIRVTISGGLTECQPDEPFERSLERADRLLYQAKANGRNRIETDIQTENLA